MNIDALAAATVALLSPYLAEAAKAAAKKAGEAISGIAPKIYQAVKARFAQRQAASEALTDLEQNPADEDLQAALRVQLKKLLVEDPDFGRQLEQLLEMASPGETTTIVQAIGEGTVVAGDDNIVVGKKGVYVGRDAQGPITSGDS